MELNSTVKRDWLKALRSGEYKQANNRLCNRLGEMCCLGVLYDSAIDGEWVQGLTGWLIPGPTLEKHNGFALPRRIRDKIGLDHSDEAQLIRMNDNQRRNFAYIANWIETNL